MPTDHSQDKTITFCLFWIKILNLVGIRVCGLQKAHNEFVNGPTEGLDKKPNWQQGIVIYSKAHLYKSKNDESDNSKTLPVFALHISYPSALTLCFPTLINNFSGWVMPHALAWEWAMCSIDEESRNFLKCLGGWVSIYSPVATTIYRQIMLLQTAVIGFIPWWHFNNIVMLRSN